MMTQLLTGFKKAITPPYRGGDIPAIVVIFFIFFLFTTMIFAVGPLTRKESTNYQRHSQVGDDTMKPENRTLTGNTTVVDDPNASGGKYVLPGSISASLTPTPTTPVIGSTVTLDYSPSNSPGPLQHIAAGVLHAFSDSLSNGPLISPSSLFSALKLKLFRAEVQEMAQTYKEAKRLNGTTGALFIGVLSDAWNYGATPPWDANGSYDAWLEMVITQVNQVKASIPAGQRGYDFFNEFMDGIGADPRMKEAYRLTYQLIKTGLPGHNSGVALDPEGFITLDISASEAMAVGGSGVPSIVKDWMAYCVQHDVIPTFWSWHFGNLNIIQQTHDYLGYAESVGAHVDGMILEYLTWENGHYPGYAAYEMSELEEAGKTTGHLGLIGSARARWPITTDLGHSVFYANSSWRKHGIWYLYANLAMMTGQRAAISANGSPRLLATASTDRAKGKAWAIIGNEIMGSGSIGDAGIRVQGLQTLSGSTNVTLSRIPYNNCGEVTNMVNVIDNEPHYVSGGTTTIHFTWGDTRDAYFLELTAN